MAIMVKERAYSDHMDGKMTQFTRGKDVNSKEDSSWGDPNTQSVSYFYDALGRRVAKSGRLKKRAAFTQSYGYLVDQDKILLAKSGGSDLTLYLDGEGIDEHLGQVSAREALGYATDHLGSVLNSTAAGPFHSFGPWGETLAGWQLGPDVDASPVVYGYAGMEFDPESGVYYDRARMYSPTLGRFLQRDPIGFEGGDANLFRYVRNNPLIYADPTGLDIWYFVGGGSYAIGSSPGSTTGSAASFGVGVGYDTETGETFTFSTSGSGTQASGAFIGGGASLGYFPGSQQQFLGSGIANNVAAGVEEGAGISGVSSSGVNGYQLDLFGISYGATVNTQETNTNFLGHVAGPLSCGK